MKIHRLAVLVLLPTFVVGLTATGASATDHKAHAGTPYSLTISAGFACQFPVSISGIDDTVATPRPDGTIYTHGYYDVTVTNLTTGESVFRVASGPGVINPKTGILSATGTWVLLVGRSPGEKARLLLVTGKFKVGFGDPYDRSPGTKIVNLCRLVS